MTRRIQKSLLRRSLDTLPQRVALELAQHVDAWDHALSGTPATRAKDSSKYAAPVVSTLEMILQYARDGRRSPELDVEAAVIQQSWLLDAPLARMPRSLQWLDDYQLRGIAGEVADVCRAAMARLRIEHKQPVPRRWFAALVGFDLRTIKRAVETHELQCVMPRTNDNGGAPMLHIDPGSARRYLTDRGFSL